jgi:hypothetical protein
MPSVTACPVGNRVPTLLNLRVDYEIDLKNETASAALFRKFFDMSRVSLSRAALDQNALNYSFAQQSSATETDGSE